MSWISDIGTELGGAVSSAEGAITTVAQAGHTLLGSQGSLTVGNVSIGTGVTQGDIATTKTITNANVSGALNTNIFSSMLTEITSNPLILLAIIAVILILVMKK